MKRLKECDTAICHAECCGIVPIPNETLKQFAYLLRPDVKFTAVDEKTTVCVDKENRCGFLTEDCKCAIYENRPEICRIFGNPGEKHPCLTCSYKRKKGKNKDTFRKEEILKLCEQLGIE